MVEPEREPLPWGTGFESWGRGARCGCSHRGEGRVYWFDTRNAPKGEKDGPPGGPTGPRTTLLDCFSGWHHPVRELIESTTEAAIRRDDIYDREPPTERWGEGRVTLLGDAPWPMTPDLGQGACQAIEDAVILARCLREPGIDVGGEGVPAAPRRYERLRIGRVAKILRRSRRFGQIAQLENLLLYRLRNLTLAAIPPKARLREIEGVMGYDAWNAYRG